MCEYSHQDAADPDEAVVTERGARLTFRVTREEYDAMRRFMDANGVPSVSELVRRALRWEISQPWTPVDDACRSMLSVCSDARAHGGMTTREAEMMRTIEDACSGYLGRTQR